LNCEIVCKLQLVDDIIMIITSDGIRWTVQYSISAILPWPDLRLTDSWRSSFGRAVAFDEMCYRLNFGILPWPDYASHKWMTFHVRLSGSTLWVCVVGSISAFPRRPDSGSDAKATDRLHIRISPATR
jgi:hypothetical protein